MRARLVVAAVAVAALALVAGTAGAATYPVAGNQITVDEENGLYRMTGSLVGDWTSVIDWNTLQVKQGSRTYTVTLSGTESFAGCVDRNRNGRCEAGDTNGTLAFTFDYKGLFRNDDSLLIGGCVHPIVGGTGAFAGASGTIRMVDLPRPNGSVTTTYFGTIRTSGLAPASLSSASRSLAASRPHVAC